MYKKTGIIYLLSVILGISMLCPQPWEAAGATGNSSGAVSSTKTAAQETEAYITKYVVPGAKVSITPEGILVNAEKALGKAKPEFTLSKGATAYIAGKKQVSGSSTVDFSKPVVYEIASEDGETRNRITVTVTVQAQKDTPAFTSFSLSGVEGVIDEKSSTITVSMNSSVDLKGLIADFRTTAGTNVYVNSKRQTSNSTANDFRKPLEYVLESDHGKRTYKVQVEPVTNQCRMLTFKIGNVQAIINENKKTITAVLPANQKLTGLKAEFTSSEKTKVYAPARKGKLQVSKVTANDFSKPLTYYVVADSGTFQKYTVTLTNKKAYQFTAFTLAGYTGKIDQVKKTITVDYPEKLSTTNLVATFSTNEPCKVRVGARSGALQTSGSSSNSFNTRVLYYLCDAKGDDAVAYTVILRRTPSGVKEKKATPTNKLICPEGAKQVVAMPARLGLDSQYFWVPSVAGQPVSVSIKSDAPAVVECGRDGVYYAKTVGSATLTTVLTYKNASTGKTAKKTVTQKVNVVIPVTKVSLSHSTVTLGVKKTLALRATVMPSNATDKEITWSSSNAQVATVSSTGLVRGMKKGSCTLMAKTEDGIVGRCTVTVK